MSTIEELYQEELTYHSQHPCNNDYPMDCPTHGAEGKNPLCGDIVKLHVAMDGDRIEKIVFGGTGCVISQSAASMLTEAVKGKTVTEVKKLGAALEEALATPKQQPVNSALSETLDGLNALLGVRQFPVRKKCALLAWSTLKKILPEE